MASGDVLPPEGSYTFASEELAHNIAALGAGAFLLLREQFPTVPDGAGLVAHINPLATPKGKGGQRVTFGQIEFASGAGPEFYKPVAIKRFGTPYVAAAEAGAMATVNATSARQGGEGPVALEPLGFYRSPDTGQPAVLTGYDSTVTSQKDFWVANPSRQAASQAFETAALSLAGLHTYGFAYGNARAENIATGARGRPMVTGLAGMRRLSVLASIDTDPAFQAVIGDLQTYVESLGKMEGAPANYQWLVRDMFTPVYGERVDWKGLFNGEVARGIKIISHLL